MSLRLFCPLRPLPQPSSDLDGQPMTRLSRQQHDLSTMMSLVRHQVCEDMHNIYGQVHPRHSRRWDSAALLDTEFKELEDSVTASLERRHQLTARHRVSAHTL